MRERRIGSGLGTLIASLLVFSIWLFCAIAPLYVAIHFIRKYW